MPRHPKPQELKLSEKGVRENGVQPGPNSSPMNLQGVDLGSFGGGFEHDVAAGLTPLPKEQGKYPQSPPGSPRAHNRDSSKNLLSSFRNKLSNEQEERKNSRQGRNEKEEYRPGTSSVSKIYHLRNNPGSTPELSLVGSQEAISKQSSESEKPALPARPQPTPKHSQDSTASRQRSESKKENKGLLGRMGRRASVRRGSNATGSRPATLNGDGNQSGDGNKHDKDSFDHQSQHMAPSDNDWPGSDARLKGKHKEDKRGKSEERSMAIASQENLSSSFPKAKDKKEGGGFMSGLKKATGGFLGRTKSDFKSHIPDSEYVIKVINLPLIEQTRATRISKDLASCRDKTEYWMPALPWRCIDYLNTNCENEGLYRVPGSGPQVKHWQRRFDQELDIDLLDADIKDTNEIASMLKAWFRELPTEVMPASLQKSLGAELEKQNPNYRNQGQEAPQLLRDALSELPPFNYYLLFAITCHLSLLLTNKDRNKMDLNNLAVCVGPCLNLERWLFNYLVGDWRHCWQGCFTEKEYLNIERLVEDGHDPDKITFKKKPMGDEHSLSNSLWASTIGDDAPSENMSTDDRAISSGSSNQQGSNYDRRGSHVDLHNRGNNNANPMTYVPAGANAYGGNHGLGIEQEIQRPSTAQGGPPPMNTTGMQQQPQQHQKTRSNSSTPRVGHQRSRSDLPPATPVKTNADYGFPVRSSSRPPSRSSMRRG
ncbi:uncharacterized protein RHO25_012742 [Cercospora beticola]|nr:hypothetical protein RHO25_012742 [Cercospora beticola]